jgi:hypothetical protein
MTSAYLANLKARRDAIATELAALDMTKAGGKPNLSSTDGGTAIDHVGYKDALYRELREIDGLIRAAAETEAALNAGDGGPFEISTDLIP